MVAETSLKVTPLSVNVISIESPEFIREGKQYHHNKVNRIAGDLTTDEVYYDTTESIQEEVILTFPH